jgi:Tfp pilus assembly PilM family ATPase
LHKKFEPRSFNEVEEFKRVEGHIPPPGNYSGAKSEEIAEMGKIARTVMTRIHNEITRSVTFYRTTQKGAAPMRVFLAGGGAGSGEWGWCVQRKRRRRRGGHRGGARCR